MVSFIPENSKPLQITSLYYDSSWIPMTRAYMVALNTW